MIIWERIELENYRFDRSTNTIIRKHGKPLKLTIDKDGYLIFFILNDKRQKIYYHRFIFYMFHPVIEKEWDNFFIEHIDNNKTNNSPENLRLICQNKISVKNKTGFHYVYPNGNKFQVMINIRGKSTHFGNFDTALEAAEHYDNIKNDIYKN